MAIKGLQWNRGGRFEGFIKLESTWQAAGIKQNTVIILCLHDFADCFQRSILLLLWWERVTSSYSATTWYLCGSTSCYWCCDFQPRGQSSMVSSFPSEPPAYCLPSALQSCSAQFTAPHTILCILRLSDDRKEETASLWVHPPSSRPH